MRVTLIHNSEAGVEQSSKHNLLELLEQNNYEVAYCSYKEDDYASALTNPGELVAVAGGDGTVQTVAHHLIGRNIPIAILPLGTANNMAKSLGISGNPKELITGWAIADRKNVDVGFINSLEGEKHFFESVGMGMFCQLMQQHKQNKDTKPSAESRQGEFNQVLKQLQEMLPDYRANACNIRLDNQELSGNYLLIEAMNMKAVGPRMAMAPDADPGDGLLDVIVIGAENRLIFAEYLSNRLSGKEHRTKLPVYRTKQLEVICENTIFHVDDNILEKKSTGAVRISLKPQQLVFMINR